MRAILLVLLLFAGSTSAQLPFITDIWQKENRLPAQVRVLVLDQQRYLLAGTDQGLFRFNGSRFKEIHSGLSKEISALSLIKSRVWVGFRDGKLGYIDDDSVRFMTTEDYQAGAAIHHIAAGPGNSLLVATEEGLVHLKDDRAVRYRKASGLTDDYLYATASGGKDWLLAASDQGINRLVHQGEKIKIAAHFRDQLPDNIVRVIKPVPATRQFWVGMQEKGVGWYDPEKNTFRLLLSTWPYGQVNDILPVTSNLAYIATQEGYIVQARKNAEDSWQTEAYAYPGSRFNSLCLDRTGNLWCGTDKGLSLHTAEYLSFIPLPLPYRLQDVKAVTWNDKGECWLGIKSSLYRYCRGTGANQLELICTTPNSISALHHDATGRLWIGTAGSGLWYLPYQSRHLHKTKSLTPGDENILSIASGNKSLWISTLNGVSEFYLGNTEATSLLALKARHNKASGVGSDYIYQLMYDSEQRLWMATDGSGACMYDGKTYHHWPQFQNSDNNVVYSIAEDIYGTIWAGTIFNDLFRFTRGKWANIRRPEHSATDITPTAIAANNTGQVIAVYDRRIDIWYPNSGHFRQFTGDLFRIDSTSRALNCITKDAEGNVYIPSPGGLLVFKNQNRSYDIRPGIAIAGISNNLKQTSISRKRFKHDENYFSIQFEGICFTNPERLHYRYKLDGHNNAWIYTNEGTATFPKLPDGSYKLRVQASLSNDFHNASETNYEFSIAAPLWKRPWFIGMVIIFVVLATILLVRFREKKMKRLAQLEQERVVYDYEHLKSQVNPHFLFNSLNTLTNLIEERPGDAVLYTQNLSDLYRNMLHYRNKALISFREEWNILSTYLHIQQSRFGDALQISSSVTTALQSKWCIPPMALQLLVENAIKHNIVSQSMPLVIKISITEDHMVEVENRIQRKLSPEAQSGIGLSNIRNRYALLTEQQVTWGEENGHWIVRLPLL
jgi:ligand-binding sensor domain-containing protein